MKLFKQRNLVYILFFILCQIAAWAIGYRQVIGYSHVSPDFESYFLASKVLANGENPYLLENLSYAKNTDDLPFPYLYTPIAAQLVTPITTLDFSEAAIIWGLFLVTTYGLCIFLTGIFCLRITQNLHANASKHKWVTLAVSLVFGVWFPYIINIQIGQINIFILFLLMIYLFALAENKPFTAGLLLGFCTIVKIVPAFLLLCHLRSDKKFFVGFVLGIMSMLGFSILLFGLTPWADFVEALPKFSYGTQVEGLWEISAVYNIALSGTLARIFHDDARSVFMAAIALGIPVLLYFCTTAKRYPIQSFPFFIQIGIATILMVLFSPIAYVHHIIWLYPFLFLYGLYIVIQQNKLKYLFLAVYSILLIIINIDFTFKYYAWSINTWTLIYLPINTIGLAILVLMMMVSLKITKPLMLA